MKQYLVVFSKHFVVNATDYRQAGEKAYSEVLKNLTGNDLEIIQLSDDNHALQRKMYKK